VHFHAEYQGFETFVSIETGDIIEGHLPTKAARIVREWAAEHRAELLENWTKAVILSHCNASLEPTMIKIVKAEHIRQAQLRLTFSDGTQGDYDFAPLLAKETVLTLPLQNPEYFKAYFIELGAVCWKNGLEFSPAALHLELQSAGKLSRVQQPHSGVFDPASGLPEAVAFYLFEEEKKERATIRRNALRLLSPYQCALR